MKVLLLTLLLGVVCPNAGFASEDPQVLESLHTIYVGATDPEAIADNSPLRGFVRKVERSDDGNTITVNFYTKIDGVCQLQTVVGKRTDATSMYEANYQGKLTFTVFYLKSNLLVITLDHTSEEGKLTRIIGLIGTGDDVPEVDYKKYVTMATVKDIPEENIIKVIDSENYIIKEDNQQNEFEENMALAFK